MHTRTTIMLDPSSRKAARQLASHLDVTPSEVIRRALVQYRDQLLGAPEASVRARLVALDRSLSVFRDVDPHEEVRRMKREDAGW